MPFHGCVDIDPVVFPVLIAEERLKFSNTFFVGQWPLPVREWVLAKWNWSAHDPCKYVMD